MTIPQKLELAEAEIARLENLIQIQQKQIERLMDARDAEKLLKEMAVKALNKRRKKASKKK